MVYRHLEQLELDPVPRYGSLQGRSEQGPALMPTASDGSASTKPDTISDNSRRMLEHLPVSGDDRELVLVEVTIPPGGRAPPHRHPVGGIVYIVEGVAESAYGSDEPRRYRAGETLQDRADALHTVFRNCDTERPLRFLAFYLLEPGRSYLMDQ